MTTITASGIGRHGCALLICTGALGSFAAIAAESQTPEQVTVEATRAPTKALPGQVVRVELRGQVSYSDLDLSNEGNAKVLKGRVHDAARMICSDLDKMYHLMQTTGDCASKAEQDAMPQVEAAVAAAQRTAKAK